MDQEQPRPTRWRVVVAFFVLVNVALAAAAVVLFATRPTPKPRSHGFDGYVSQGDTIPQAEQVPGVPFLRKQEDVTYMRPEAVPAALHDKLQSLDELSIILERMTTEPRNDPGNAVGVTERVIALDPSSVLATGLGLRVGDEILSINGWPVPETLAEGRFLHERLRSVKYLAIKVRRGGQPVILTVYVQ